MSTGEPGGARVRAWVTTIGAVVAASVGTSTLLFVMFPGWRPDPRERAEATIQVLRLDEDVTQAAFLRRVDRAKPKGCRDAELRWLGVVVYVQGDVSGFKGGAASLRWSLYRGAKRHAYFRSSTNDPAVFRPRAPVNREIAQVWLPHPREPGDYHARFELYTGDVLRAIGDTRVFSVPPVPPDLPVRSWCTPRANTARRRPPVARGNRRASGGWGQRSVTPSSKSSQELRLPFGETAASVRVRTGRFASRWKRH